MQRKVETVGPSKRRLGLYAEGYAFRSREEIDRFLAKLEATRYVETEQKTGNVVLTLDGVPP